MRKNLEIVALAALAIQAWIVAGAFYGPTRLPDRVPIHFDMAGHANGWGSASSFLLLPVISVAIYLLLTVVARFPSTFNYPVKVTEENRPRLQALAVDMLAWIKVEMVCLFGWVLWIALDSARRQQAPYPPLLLAPLVVFFATVVWYIVVISRAALAKPQA